MAAAAEQADSKRDETEMTSTPNFPVRRRFRVSLLAAILSSSLWAGAACAATNPCEPEILRAADRYGMASQDADRAARDYRACVWSSRGHDECRAAWDRLDSANGRLQDAVGDIREDCEDR